MLLKPMSGIPNDVVVTNQALIKRGGHNDRQKFWLEGHDDSESERTIITLVGESGIFYTYGGSAALLYTIIEGVSIGVEDGVLVAFFPCSMINIYKKLAEQTGYRLH